MDKKFMINPILNRSIQQIIKKDPKADQQKVLDQIIRMNNISMKKQVIKVGIRHYFKKNKPESKPITIVSNDQNFGLDNLKKKVKRNPLQIDFIDKQTYKFENLGGIQETLADIRTYLINPIQKSQILNSLGAKIIKGFILAGPIGSGKTLIANCILSELKNNFSFTPYFINMGALLGSDAQDKIKKIFQAAVQNQPSVIMFDEIDALCMKQTSKRPQGSPISFFLNQIDKIKQQRIYLLAASSNPQKLDISLKKLNRFQKTINIGTTSDKNRQQILLKLLKKINHQISQSQIRQLSQLTSGFMAADLQVLIKQSAISCLQEQQSVINYYNIKNSLKNVQPILKKQGFTDIPKTTLDDVGGLQQLKIQLKKQIITPIQQQSKFKEMNFDLQSGGVLLYGPPGCGKTMLAKAIANAVRANFIIVKGPQLLNKYVGESEQAVRQVFGRAQRAAPCVIFFDQFDALAPKRSDQGNQVTQRVVNTLLTALDGVEQRKMVFVIAATNRKDMIDEATLRSGRIQKHLYVPQPDRQQRIDIMKAITKPLKMQKYLDFNEIAEKTQGFSGADLRFLVKQAVVSAVTADRKQINQQDLDMSLKQFLSNRNKQIKNGKLNDQDEQNEKFEFKLMRDVNKNQATPIQQQNTNIISQKQYKILKGQLIKDIFRILGDFKSKQC